MKCKLCGEEINSKPNKQDTDDDRDDEIDQIILISENHQKNVSNKYHTEQEGEK